MGALEIIIIIASIALVSGTIINAVIKKKKGKSSQCGGNCSGCNYCHNAKTEEKEE